MRDRFNRQIDYMRISLTDKCNFRCLYCMPEEGIIKLRHEDIMSIEEILEVAKAGAQLGIKKLRLTGGEPLVRKGILDLCRGLGQIKEIQDLGMTTNGSLLYPMLEDLKEAGVSRLNISLDTLDRDKFKLISRGHDLNRVLRSIDKAYDLGFKIKINTVLIGGFNTDEIFDLISLGRDRDIQVRFIELMAIGESAKWDKDFFVTNSLVLEKIPGLVPASQDGVAKTYTYPGHRGRVGLISPNSCSFCGDCNRIRLTPEGKIKPCLHSGQEINIRGLRGKDLINTLRFAIYNKDESHFLQEGSSKAQRNMNTIGG